MSTESYKQETYKLPIDSKSLLDQLAEKDSRIAELEAWKASALSVMPDFQAIGKALGLKLGTDVSPQILPRIKAMADLLDAVSSLEHHEFKRRWYELKGQP